MDGDGKDILKYGIEKFHNRQFVIHSTDIDSTVVDIAGLEKYGF